MRTIGILVTLLTVYSGVLLLAAWSLTAFNDHEERLGRSATSTQAVVAATRLSRAQPSTRWRRSTPEDDVLHHYDGAEDQDAEQTDVSPVWRVEARPATYGVMNCLVGYAGMKETRL